MIKNIIFDIGNVILDFYPLNYLLKFYNENIAQDLYLIIFKSKEWTLLDMGEITEKEATHYLVNKYPMYKKEIKEVMNNWHQILVPNYNNVEIINKLKFSGYKLYLLSNFPKEAFEHMLIKYPFFTIFDGMTISYNVHLTKPDIKIYKFILDKYNLFPRETLFIDDLYENVTSAKALNINTIQYINNSKLLSDFKSLNIKLT